MPPQVFDWSGPQARESASAPSNGSFVSQLKRVEHDLNGAKALCAQHRYEAARQKLAPHLSQLPEPLAGPVHLLLGQCAMHGAGSRGPSLLHKARQHFQKTGDKVGLARTRLAQGQDCFDRGELQQSQAHLSAARRGFAECQDGFGQAMVQSLRARVYLAQHYVEDAQTTIDAAVLMWASLKEPSQEAMARQTRAQLFASAGSMSDAARDLLWAERLVGSEASADVRTQVALDRAGSLLWVGYTHRAAAALSRVSDHALSHPDPCIQAHFHKASGQALMVDAPVTAAQHLNTAIDALRRLGQHYNVAHATIYLVCCEHRLSMPIAKKLAELRAMGLSQWPVLRDALETFEPMLQAPPGRLTGPQAPKVFDPEAIAGAPGQPAKKAAAAARGHMDPTFEGAASLAASADEANAVASGAARPWTQWLSYVQQAFSGLTQERAPAPDAAGSQALMSTSTSTRSWQAAAPVAGGAAPSRRPQRSQAEITQA